MDWQTIWDFVKEVWPHLVGGATFCVDVAAMAHVVLRKRDTRSAIGWVGIIWLVPILGVILYVLLGINRVQRRAVTLRRGPSRIGPEWICAPDQLARLETPEAEHLRTFARLVGELSERALMEGNEVVPLFNGDEAYPEMLRAIGEARKTVTLATYIFDNDRAGKMFADALGAAVQRGVNVRVLVDDVGARYSSLPSVEHLLRTAKVPFGPIPPRHRCPADSPTPINGYASQRSW